MFGYVRPAINRLSEEDCERFRAAYCGLCHTLSRRYGLVARFILNYDLTFLAMLIGGNADCHCCEKRCLVHPIRCRKAVQATTAFDMAADYSVILTWWQLKDGIADHGFFKGLLYRVASLFLRRAYRKARKVQPEFDRKTREHLQELTQLEQEKCSSIDRPADTFAQLLTEAALAVHDIRQQRILQQILYHLGRWIYLIDAADDLAADVKTGNYNPLQYRFMVFWGKLSPEDQKELAQTLDQSIRLMATAFELSDFGDYTKIIESVVYEGLYAVGSSVLDGSFHKQKQERSNLTRKVG